MSDPGSIRYAIPDKPAIHPAPCLSLCIAHAPWPDHAIQICNVN